MARCPRYVADVLQCGAALLGLHSGHGVFPTRPRSERLPVNDAVPAVLQTKHAVQSQRGVGVGRGHGCAACTLAMISRANPRGSSTPSAIILSARPNLSARYFRATSRDDTQSCGTTFASSRYILLSVSIGWFTVPSSRSDHPPAGPVVAHPPPRAAVRTSRCRRCLPVCGAIQRGG